MQLNLPPPPLVRITFSGKAAISTGVVNLAALFGNTDFLLVKPLPEKSKTSNKCENGNEESDSSDCPDNNDGKIDANGTVRMQLCEHVGLPIGCFTVEAGGSYEVVRRCDLTALRDNKGILSLDHGTENNKPQTAEEAAKEDYTMQGLSGREWADELMKDDEAILAAGAPSRKVRQRRKTTTKKNSSQKIADQHTDTLGGHSQVANEKETQPVVNLPDHSTRGDNAQHKDMNNESLISTAPKQLGPYVDTVGDKKPRKSKPPAGSKHKASDKVINAEAEEEPCAPEAPVAPSRRPKNTTKRPSPPPHESSSVSNSVQRKRRPPLYYSSSRSRSPENSVSQERGEMAHTSKRVRHVPRESALLSHSPVDREEVKKARKEGEGSGVKKRKEPESPVSHPGSSPNVVVPLAPESPAQLLEFSGNRNGSSPPQSNPRTTLGEEGSHSAFAHDSPALGFTAVNNSLSQEFSLGSSSASSLADYVY